MGKTLKKCGFGIVEVLVASAIISTAIFSLYYVFVLSHRLSAGAGEKISANFLAEEGLEVMRYLRDESWEDNLKNLSVSTNYYIDFDKINSEWSVGTANPGPIDGRFTRVITVANVSRDGLDNIVLTGGTNDPDTKKINVAISWSAAPGTVSSITLSTYLSDIFNN